MAELGFDPAIMIAEIRENQKHLDGCKRHHFPTFGQVAFGMKLDCSNCGGRMCALQAGAYTRGYAAAGGNPNDVIPGWN